jgi:aspartyl-tRNA(Asn)/glutamyl-tRNA(Gln) amidotransferase subunit B
LSYIVKGETCDWEVIIGLEVHAQITSQAKLFSGSATEFGAGPNTQVSLVDAAMPGMLPVINEFCVAQAVKTGLGLKAQINLHSVFERKNYFYADLPQGYQISQFAEPIVGEGSVFLDMPDGTIREIGIERLHMEQDAGKSLHDQDPKRSFIDLNRSGVALMEIVSKPELRSPEEAGLYVRKLRGILRYLGTCNGNMEEGSMRADVNVSVRPLGTKELRTRTETKNVNSVRFVMQVVEAESVRQVNIYDEGKEVLQETRQFDVSQGQTRAMRSKEFSHDYRYFPDPDLLPVILSNDEVDAIRDTLPELPDDKKNRFIEKLGLSPYDASILVEDKEIADYFEYVAERRDPKISANWVTGNLFGALKKSSLSINNSPISAAALSELLSLIEDNIISGRIAKDVFDEMFKTGISAKDIVQDKGLEQITDTSEIEATIDNIISLNPDQVTDFKNGNEKTIGWFVGQVMKATSGKANPKLVNDILRSKLVD